jgi:ABC-type multidrug transport system ATPase subunit
VFNNVIRNGLVGKTRILVTHALHFLPHVDYIYTMVDGWIAEQGTYEDLSTREGGAFAKLVRDLAPKEEKGEGTNGETNGAQYNEVRTKEVTKKAIKDAELMRTEERSVGSVSGAGMFYL